MSPDRGMTQAEVSGSLSWGRLASHFLVAVLLFAVANVWVYRTSEFFQRKRMYTEHVALITTHPNVHVIFAGDSHFAVPLNDYLDEDARGPAYSVAAGGDSLRETFAKLREVLDTNRSIDTLILTADPHMFAKGRLESSNRSFADIYFIRAWDASGVQHNLWSAVLQQVPLFNEDYLQYFRKELAVLATGSPAHARAQGDPLAWSRLTDEERMRSAIETGVGDHAGLGDFEQPYLWYGRILELARERHVRVIGVRFPVHPGYAAQAPADQVERLDAFLTSHGVSRIVDLRDALTDPRLFEDPDHVNEHGAAAVLALLEQRLGMRLHSAPDAANQGMGGQALRAHSIREIRSPDTTAPSGARPREIRPAA
jgi:hypothetical protein